MEATIRLVDHNELLPFENGSHNSPWDDRTMSFEDMEKNFLAVYGEIFETIQKQASVEESGSGEDTDMAMSKWVDPTRVIPVVIWRLNPAFAKLVQPLQLVLKKHQGYAVMFMKSPSRLVLLSDGEILVSRDAERDFLCSFDLPSVLLPQ